MTILRAVKNIIDDKRDVESETRRFQKAQSERDYTTMWDILFHSSAQYCKKRGQGRFWDADKLYDISSEMAIYLMQRYQRNPNYHITSHITQVHYAYLHVVYGAQQKRDKEARQTCSYEATNIDKILL